MSLADFLRPDPTKGVSDLINKVFYTTLYIFALRLTPYVVHYGPQMINRALGR